jgi:hypothetical protein
MKTVYTLAAAAALALAAGCGKDDTPAPRSATPPAQSSAPAPESSSAGSSATTTRTTPADLGKPASAEEKREGANPQQGQVDPKQAEQHKDFQQRGDQAGPKSAETTPK